MSLTVGLQLKITSKKTVELDKWAVNALQLHLPYYSKHVKAFKIFVGLASYQRTRNDCLCNVSIFQKKLWAFSEMHYIIRPTTTITDI